MLLFAFGLATVPGALVGLLAFRMSTRALESRAGEQLLVVAQDVVDELGSEMAEERRNVVAWARQEVMRDLIVGDIDKRISRYLSSIVASYPDYVELFVTGIDGTIVAATEPARLGQRATLRAPENRARPVWMPAHDRLVVEWAAPVTDPDTPTIRLGRLVAYFAWARVSMLADRVRRGLAASGLDVDLLLIDDEGRVRGGAWQTIASPLEATTTDLSWHAVGALLAARRAGFALEPTLDAVVGMVPAPGFGAGWSVVALQARPQALAPAYRMRRQIAFLLVGIVGLALALGAWLAERLGRPLRELTAATRELARSGDLVQPIPVRSSDEIGELASAFNAAAADLRRARDDLVTASKLAFVGELAAGMAHEIRTPLGILRSSAQMLGRAATGSAARRDELVEMIIGEVDRLDRVVTGLTDLARPRELALQPTRLSEVLDRVVDFVERQAAERGIEVRRDLSPDVDAAWCDPDEIHQVALNLVMNAVQMMPTGGRLVVRLLPRRGDTVGFEVEDTGPGLSPERQRQIFTPFVSFREGGTGLGLALAQRTVVSHGGSISVRSVEGRGAVFRVELPVAEGAA